MYFCYFQALSLRGLVGQLQQTVRFNSSLKIQDIEVIQPERSFKVLFVEGRALFQSEKWCSIANIYHVTIFFFIIKNNVFFFKLFQYADLSVRFAPPQRLQPKPTVSALSFGKYFTDHMLKIFYHEALGGWQAPEITPFENLVLHPAAKVLHYAIEVREQR